MLNPQEASIETIKYLRKLKKIIETEGTRLFKSKIINKARLDDVLCCIEGSFPQEYREHIKKKGGRKLRSCICFQEINGAIKRKFLFSSSSYSVSYQEALNLIDTMQKSFGSDLKQIFNNNSNMI